MSRQRIVVDYLVVGAGATGMAFADTLVAESNYTLAVVDRADAPGGHWNLSYPFVRLHGPSANYGVNSRAMSSDPFGGSLASRNEILDYYDRVMHETLIGSNRVTYLPMHNYDGVDAGAPAIARVHSVLTGNRQEIVVRKRIVDASYLDIRVPAMGRPPFSFEQGATVVAINRLPQLPGTAEHFTVVGAGKTGIDACLWLLGHGVPADGIRWIMPRDAWLFSRSSKWQAGGVVTMLELAGAGTADDAIAHLEQAGVLLRRDVEPVRPPFAARPWTVARTRC